MDNLRESGYKESFHSESEGRLSLIDQLEHDRGALHAGSLEKITDSANRQAKKLKLHCSTFTGAIQASSITVTGLSVWPLGLHLPEESDIGSVYLENHSGCNLNVFEGPGGQGRLIGYGTKNTYRVIAMADNISSVSFVIDISQPTADGLVIVTLFTHKWSPKMGTII